MDADERDLFVRSLGHAAASAGYATTGADAGGDAGALDAALADLGWPEALDAAPRDAVAGLAFVQGEHAAASSALHRVLAHALTGSADGPGALLPPPGTWAPPGRVVDGRIVVRGVANAALLAGGAVTVAVAPTAGTTAGTADPGGGPIGHVTVAVADLEVRRVRGLDPEAELATVTGAANGATSLAGPASGEGGWDEAVRRGRLFLAHELQGAAASVLAQARGHALDRIQFGQPIAGFQAVRHKLAEVLIATETAEALLDAAWLDGTDLTAAMAKASAGRAGRVAAQHGQQVLAGIGFTTEHGLHRWVRRILVLDELLGSSRTLTRVQGVDLLAARALPPLLPL